MNRLDLGERIDLWRRTFRSRMAIRIGDRLQPGALDTIRYMASALRDVDRRILMAAALREKAQ